jgi:DNA polymerase I-like protein with 3'-5' exonuclease and polymerase domains
VKAGEFNPNSNPQLREYFEAAASSADSYDKHFLKGCSDPLALVLLVEYRKVAKLKNTYFVAMRTRAARNGILHPHFRQHGTRTGRMSLRWRGRRIGGTWKETASPHARFRRFLTKNV